MRYSLLFWFWAICFLSSVPAIALGATYYVANDGNDTYTGLSEAASWRTIDKVNNQSFAPGDTILFKRGDTFYGSINISSSGNSTDEITYGAYGLGEKPLLKGTMNVTGWSLYAGAIYEAVLDAPFSYLFLDGMMVPVSRFPNGGADWADGNWSGIYANIDTLPTDTTFTDAALPDVDWTGATAIFRGIPWGFEAKLITNYAAGTLTFTDDVYGLDANDPYFLINHVSTLDGPNQWAHDDDANRVYLWTPDGDSPAGHDVEVSFYDYGFFGEDVAYVSIENFTIEGFNKNGVYLYGLENSHVVIDGNDFLYNYECAVHATNDDVNRYLANNNRAITIANNIVEGSNREGFRIEGYEHNITGNVLSHIAILDTISITGYIDAYGAGNGISGYPIANSTIMYNNASYMGYAGVIFQGRNNLVAYNDINYTCITLQDCGGIYSHTDIIGSVIKNNFVSRIGPLWGGSDIGIYLDATTNGITVANNTVYDNDGFGMFISNAVDTLTTGNVFFDNDQYQLFVRRVVTSVDMWNNTITNNTFYAPYPDQDTINMVFSRDGEDVDDYVLFENNFYANLMNPVHASYNYGAKTIKGIQQISDQCVGARELSGNYSFYELEGNLTANYIANSYFDTGTSQWYASSDWVADSPLDGGALGRMFDSGYELIQSYNLNIPVAEESLFMLSFDVLGNGSDDWGSVSIQFVDGSTTFLAEDTRHHYEAFFNVVEDLTGRINFGLYGSVGDTVYIDNVELYEVAAIERDPLDLSRLFMNKGRAEKTFDISGSSYVDIYGNPLGGSLTLAPFTSMILIQSNASCPADADTFYVANDGNDSNCGTSIFSPWKTIEKVNNQTLEPGDTVLFKRGDSWIGSITISASGTESDPITYGAYGTGDKPIIRGDESVDGWSLYAGNIYRSSFDHRLNQLFVDGKRIPISRFPDLYADGSVDYLTIDSMADETTVTSSNLLGIDWTGSSGIFRGVPWVYEARDILSTVGDTITFSPNVYSLSPGEHFFMVNNLATLDGPGQWAYDASTNTLYAWMPDNASPAAHEVTAPVFDFGFYGLEKSNIRIEGLELMHHGLDGARFMGVTSNIVFADNEVIDPYACGVFFDDNIHAATANENVSITNNTIIGAVRTGIMVEGSYFNISHNTIINSSLNENLGVDGFIDNVNTANAINAYPVEGSVISHNIIDNVGYAGIMFYGQDSDVSYNLVNNTCQYLYDCGGIYFHQNVTGTYVRNNIVANVPQDNGIYADGNTYGGTIANNTVFAVGGYGLLVHACKYVFVLDNTAYNAGMSQLYLGNRWNNTPSLGNYVKGNILFSPYADQETLTSWVGDGQELEFDVINNSFYSPLNFRSLRHSDAYVGSNSIYTASLSQYESLPWASGGREFASQKKYFTVLENLSGNYFLAGLFNTSSLTSANWQSHMVWVNESPLGTGGAGRITLSDWYDYTATYAYIDVPITSTGYVVVSFDVIAPASHDVGTIGLKPSYPDFAYFIMDEQKRHYEFLLNASSDLNDHYLTLRSEGEVGDVIYYDNFEIKEVNASVLAPLAWSVLFVNANDQDRIFASLGHNYTTLLGESVGETLTLEPFTSEILIRADYACVERMETYYGSWDDLACAGDGVRQQTRNVTTFDANNCGEFSTDHGSEYRVVADDSCASSSSGGGGGSGSSSGGASIIPAVPAVSSFVLRGDSGGASFVLSGVLVNVSAPSSSGSAASAPAGYTLISGILLDAAVPLSSATVTFSLQDAYAASDDLFLLAGRGDELVAFPVVADDGGVNVTLANGSYDRFLLVSPVVEEPAVPLVPDHDSLVSPVVEEPAILGDAADERLVWHWFSLVAIVVVLCGLLVFGVSFALRRRPVSSVARYVVPAAVHAQDVALLRLRSYVVAMADKGFDRSIVREHLLQVGWDKALVDDLLEDAFERSRK